MIRSPHPVPIRCGRWYVRVDIDSARYPESIEYSHGEHLGVRVVGWVRYREPPHVRRAVWTASDWRAWVARGTREATPEDLERLGLPKSMDEVLP